MNPAGLITGFMKFGFALADIAAEQDADNAAAALQSREWQRAMRTVESQRVDTLVRGGMQAGAIRTRGTQLQGQQRVGFAAAGIDANSGTAALLQDSAGLYTELDAATTKNNAYRAALGLERVKMQLGDEALQAQQARKNRDTARAFKGAAAGLDVVSSALGGAFGGG